MLWTSDVVKDPWFPLVKDPSGSMSSYNALPAILRTWFGDDAGLPGRSDRVRFRRNANTIVMEPFGANASSTSGLRPWERYSREAIPPAFGLTFNSGAWNARFVVSSPHIFLLVTLTKEDMNPEHQYSDHFLSDLEFNWQSQNRTTQESKHGQILQDHRTRGLHVHLFVRPTKKTGQKPTPFIYCGEVDFAAKFPAQWNREFSTRIREHLSKNRQYQLRWRLDKETTTTISTSAATGAVPDSHRRHSAARRGGMRCDPAQRGCSARDFRRL
jgi:Domain of unknown function (DUF3427)